jgi:hypothetical protein
MHKSLFQWGAVAALLALLVATPAKAQENSDVRPVAEALGQRAAAATPQTQQQGGLSDSAVRVLLTYAFSLIPDTRDGPDGKPVKIDKSDPNVFLIPDVDARRIIRAATRSAYAQACQLDELARANYNALMQTEMAKKVWSDQQLLMINALHMFSASYFSGDAKISEAPDQAAGAAKGEAAPGTDLVAPKRPECPPEQKQKVVNSITAYVQSAKASLSQAAPAQPPAQAPAPAVPAASGSN